MATADETAAEALTTIGSAPAPATTPDGANVSDAIRHYFRDDAGRMTMLAARKFRVSEQVVVEAMAGRWPVTRLREGTFRALIHELESLGVVRVFVRSRAAVIEAVGTFGGLSEGGPFLNVQSETLDMHILPEEVAAAFAVEKPAHDTGQTSYSFQFFDRAGDAAFKVFLWEDFPDVPAHRIEAFRALAARFSAAADPAAEAQREPAAAAGPATPGVVVSRTGVPLPVPPSEEPAPGAEDEGSAPAPPRVAIPIPEGVIPGTPQAIGTRLLETPVVEPSRRPPSSTARLFRIVRRVAAGLAAAVVLYLMLVTFVTPLFWRHYEHHFRLSEAPRHALSAANRPSDPLNVGLIGADWEVIRALVAAGWKPSDPSTFQTGLKFARDELKSMRYPSATLADLYLYGRRQDLMFEKAPPGGKPGLRALRLWKSTELGMGGRPLWIGTVSLDRGPAPGKEGSDRGSHRIAADVDAERDNLMNDLAEAFRLKEIFHATGAGPSLLARNDLDQPYFTDGELAVGVVTPTATSRVADRLPSPWGVRLKDQLWNELRPFLRDLAAD